MSPSTPALLLRLRLEQQILIIRMMIIIVKSLLLSRISEVNMGMIGCGKVQKEL